MLIYINERRNTYIYIERDKTFNRADDKYTIMFYNLIVMYIILLNT